MSHPAPQDPHGHGGDPNEHHEHVLPLKTYFGVFGALIFLTIITVAVSYMNLGPRALFVAIVVATIKAALVVGYFMHLKFDVRFHSLIFFSSLIFLVIFFAFTFLDLGSRTAVVLEQETMAYQRDEANQRRGDTPAGKSPTKDLPSVDAMPPPIEGGDTARALPQPEPQAPAPSPVTPPPPPAIPDAPK